jgi:hypothetical protein
MCYFILPVIVFVIVLVVVTGILHLLDGAKSRVIPPNISAKNTYCCAILKVSTDGGLG